MRERRAEADKCRQLCEARPEPRGSSADAGLGQVLHLDVEAAVRGQGGVGLTVHALVVAPRPRPRLQPAELPRGWAQQGLVLVAGGARAGVAGAGGHERGAVRGLQARPRVDGGRGVRRQIKVGGQEAREIGGGGGYSHGTPPCSFSHTPDHRLTVSSHNLAGGATTESLVCSAMVWYRHKFPGPALVRSQDAATRACSKRLSA